MRKLGAKNTADLVRMLRCKSPLMVLSGHTEMSAYLSAFGAKRTFKDAGLR